jgi:hypothetical protein
MRGNGTRVSKAERCGTRVHIDRASVPAVAICVIATFAIAICVVAIHVRDALRGGCDFVGLRRESETARESISVGCRDKCSSTCA